MPEDSQTRQETHPGAPQPGPISLVSAADLINPRLTVGEVMTAGPRTCALESSVVEAALIYRDCNCGAIPVTQVGKPVGILTDRDLALAVADYQGDLSDVTVGDLMAKDLVTLGADATLSEALHKLGNEGVRRLLVVDSSGRLAGILSWVDLIPHISERALGRVVAMIAENR